MKKLAVLAVCTLVLLSSSLLAKDKIRIGIYDSRAVYVGLFQGGEFQPTMKALRDDFNQAKEKGDTIKLKKLEEKGQLMQRIAHDKGFGRGSIADILEKKNLDFKSIAEKEKLSVILSKWEVNFSSPDVELVDITMQLLDLIKANDNVKKMAKEMDQNKPIEDAFFIED
jgi:Skp family chaperone for outer membrane proteins